MVEAREPADFTAVLELATSVLSRYYHQYLVQNYAWFRRHPEAPRLLYFTLIGYNQATEEIKTVLLESKDNELPFKMIPVGPVLTMPRVLSVEAKLLRMQQDAPSLEEVAGFCRQTLRNIAAAEENVGGPFQSVIVNARGCYFQTEN